MGRQAPKPLYTVAAIYQDVSRRVIRVSKHCANSLKFVLRGCGFAGVVAKRFHRSRFIAGICYRWICPGGAHKSSLREESRYRRGPLLFDLLFVSGAGFEPDGGADEAEGFADLVGEEARSEERRVGKEG